MLQRPLRRVLTTLTVGAVMAVAAPGTAFASSGDLFEGMSECLGSLEVYSNTATATGSVDGIDIAPAQDEWSATFTSVGTCVGLMKFSRGTDGEVPVTGAEFAVFEDDGGAPGEMITDAEFRQVSGRPEALVIVGLDTGTYWLMETRAPQGHSLLAEPIAFSISPEGVVSLTEASPSLVSVSDEDTSVEGADTLMVVNLPAFGLPLVGGEPVALGLLGAAVLFAALAAALRKRKSRRAAD